MRKILNVSNHVLGLDQIKELADSGYEVVELSEELKKAWAQLNPETYVDICNQVTSYADKVGASAMHVAGFPAAVTYLVSKNMMPFFYAYSERVSIEDVQPDDSVVKKNIFKHKGFYQYKMA